MANHLDKYIELLGDREQGWVTRRDAADALSAVASKALAALKSFENESDTDVRIAIDHALGKARGALQGVKPVAAEKTEFTMADFAAAISKPPKRVVEIEGDGLTVTAVVADGRTQTIRIEPHKPQGGMAMVRVSTRCGKPKADSYDWALRTNMSMAQCALALTEEDGEEMLMLVNHFLADQLTPREIKTAVKEISYYGDWIENKMTGQDRY